MDQADLDAVEHDVGSDGFPLFGAVVLSMEVVAVIKERSTSKKIGGVGSAGSE